MITIPFHDPASKASTLTRTADGTSVALATIVAAVICLNSIATRQTTAKTGHLMARIIPRCHAPVTSSRLAIDIPFPSDIGSNSQYLLSFDLNLFRRNCPILYIIRQTDPGVVVKSDMTPRIGYSDSFQTVNTVSDEYGRRRGE